VHGITLSTEQKAWAEARTAGMDGAASRSPTIVTSAAITTRWSASRWPRRSGGNIGRLISPRSPARSSPGGRAALQVITFDDALFEGYAGNVDFIQRYIFPGGLLIRESEFRRLAASNGLDWRDQVNFGLDYAETLKRWRENFEAAAGAGCCPRNSMRASSPCGAII
jgi:cyclopropane-fatty-acyl-phospholipid synthase